MNIVKFKNIKIGEDNLRDRISDKYAYVIRCQYVIPLDEITYEEYVTYEKNGIDSFTGVSIDINLVKSFIDEIETKKANDITKFKVANDSIYHGSVDIDELREFRTWLARNLFEFVKPGSNSDIIDYINKQYGGIADEGCDKVRTMLNYYINLMYDDIIKTFSSFPKPTLPVGITIQSGCDCGTSLTQVDTSNMVLGNMCDPILDYRTRLYSFMVRIFSDTVFWKLLGGSFLENVAVRIDEIVKNHFTLTTNIIDRFEDCTCKNNIVDEQTRLENILNNVVISMRAIASDSESEDKNFIIKSLNDWAKYLYEKMYWK